MLIIIIMITMMMMIIVVIIITTTATIMIIICCFVMNTQLLATLIRPFTDKEKFKPKWPILSGSADTTAVCTTAII